MITTLETTKTVLGISDTTQDALITLYIPLVEADYLKIRNVPFSLDTDGTTIIYPDGSDISASLMIGFKINQRADGRLLKSENIDGYSFSLEGYSGTTNGYPGAITSSIKKFIDGR